MVAAPRVAEPCSCSTPETKISPADGSANVPLNAIVIAQLHESPILVELRLAATNEIVSMTFDLRGSTFFGTPIVPLQANTAYTVTVGNGGPNPTVAMFTTGDRIDEINPYFYGLTSVSFETMAYPVPDEDGSMCFSTCVVGADGRISRIVMDYEPLPDDAVYAVLRVRRKGGPVIELPLRSFDDRVFGYSYCSVRSPPLEPGAEYCAQLSVYDVTGKQNRQPDELCSVVATCAPRLKPSPFGPCDPSDECVIEPADEDEPDTGCGCTSTPSPGWMLFAGVAFAISRRRALRTAA